MSWRLLDPRIRHIAQEALTEKQLVAYRLHCNGFSEARIAALLGISRRSVRDRLLAADIKINTYQEAA